jgi:hypothetical protein
MSGARAYSDGGFRLESLPNGWLVGRFAVLEGFGVTHVVTTRQGPDVQEICHETATAGRRIAAVLGLEQAAFLEQTHGGRAMISRAAGCVGRADGLATSTPGLALLGKSGDCPIVLFADKRGHAVGFAHASWRATVAGIVPAVVGRMVDLGCQPAEIAACICPSAGPECYEVGAEVRAAALDQIGPHAVQFFRPGPGGRDHFDLWQANSDALIRSGLLRESIHVAGLCTMCRNDLFPSHRREGNAAGRFAAVIGLV